MTWVDFISSCPAKGCNNGRTDIRWSHYGCDDSKESINEEGNIRCSKCNDIHFILNASFRCQNHSEFRQCDVMRVFQAMCIIAQNTGFSQKERTDLCQKFLAIAQKTN